MAQKQKRKAKNSEQSQRFKEAARKLGADESGEMFERAFKKIVPEKLPESPDKALASSRSRNHTR
jgi:hypothetical protein